MPDLRLVHSSDEEYVCIECGFVSPSRQFLESHWEAEEHSPQNVQQQRLNASKKNEGWLLDDD